MSVALPHVSERRKRVCFNSPEEQQDNGFARLSMNSESGMKQLKPGMRPALA